MMIKYAYFATASVAAILAAPAHAAQDASAPAAVAATAAVTTAADGRTTIYQAGDSFVEPANRLHLVRNASASDTAEFIAIQLRPEGTGARIDAVAPVNNCDLS